MKKQQCFCQNPACGIEVNPEGQFCPECGTPYAFYGATKKPISSEKNEKTEPLPKGDYFPQKFPKRKE